MFEFYPTHRKCPACRNLLLTATLVTARNTGGPLARMGVTCYCVSCNRRYRAASFLPYAALGWLGPLGRRLWWLTTSLELTLKPEEF